MSSDPARDSTSDASPEMEAITIEPQFLTAVKAEVQTLLLSDELELPRISNLANRIMRIAADPNVDVDQIVDLVQTDEFLAGRILQLINSAYFATRQDVQSLRHAIVLLGLKSVGDLIFSSSMKMKVFKCERYEGLMRSLWEHSVGTAVATEVIAQLRGAGTEPGFMAGLLHGIGKPLILTAIVSTEERTYTEPIGKRAVIAILDRLHTRVGGLLGKKWRVSDVILDAVCNHDTYGTETKPLAAYVHCGSKIANHVGLGYATGEINPARDPAMVDLEIAAPATFQKIVATVEAHSKRMLNVY